MEHTDVQIQQTSGEAHLFYGLPQFSVLAPLSVHLAYLGSSLGIWSTELKTHRLTFLVFPPWYSLSLSIF